MSVQSKCVCLIDGSDSRRNCTPALLGGRYQNSSDSRHRYAAVPSPIPIIPDRHYIPGTWN